MKVEGSWNNSNFIYLILPIWAYRIKQRTESNMHSDVIVKQYNIMSTQVLLGCHVRGETEIPESSSNLRHGHLRLDGIHTLHHHPGTEAISSIGHSLISSHIGRGCHTNKTTDTAQVRWIARSSKHNALVRSSERGSIINQQMRCQPLRMRYTTLGSLTAPVTDIATHCLADRLVGRPQRIPNRCTPLRGTGSHPQRSSTCRCLSTFVRALSTPPTRACCTVCHLEHRTKTKFKKGCVR